MHECIIGLLNELEGSELVSCLELQLYVKEQESKKESYENDPYYRITHFPKFFYSLSDYCDKRKSTNLTRFDFCPYCGNKIDWKALRKLV